MKKTLLILLFTIISANFAAAQNNREIETERKAMIKELRQSNSKNVSDNALSLNAADVGEPDSFGKNVKFLGTATTGTVYVYYSCDLAILSNELGLTLGADDRCLALPTLGQNVSATFNDIGRINLPKNSADNVIYFINTNFINYILENNSPNQIYSNFSYYTSMTIVSDALNDPAAVDPDTGLPLNGSFTVGVGSRLNGKTYEANARENIFDRFTTSATRGFARSYFADLGLPQNVINQLYKKPMTIKLNLRISANFLSYGQFGYSTRFLGN